MSAHQESTNPVAQIIQTGFVILIPLSLVVMLGIVGAALIGGSGHIEPPAAPENTIAAVTPAPAAPETTDAEPPAATDQAAAKTDPKGTAENAAAPEKDQKEPGPTTAAVDAPTTDEQAAGSAPSADQMALGKTTYGMCAACHGPDGKGMKAGPMTMAPSFVGSELLLGKPEASIAAVLKGITRKPDSKYMQTMMALGAGLDDEKLAAVLTYVRNSFGNKASAITAEQVAAAREKYASVSAPGGMPREDLEEIARQK